MGIKIKKENFDEAMEYINKETGIENRYHLKNILCMLCGIKENPGKLYSNGEITLQVPKDIHDKNLMVLSLQEIITNKELNSGNKQAMIDIAFQWSKLRKKLWDDIEDLFPETKNKKCTLYRNGELRYYK